MITWDPDKVVYTSLVWVGSNGKRWLESCFKVKGITVDRVPKRNTTKDDGRTRCHYRYNYYLTT